MNGCFSCGISVCIDTSVKLFVFLFVCGVYLSAGSLIDTMSDLQSSAIRSTNASSNVTEDQFFYLIHFETKPCKAKQEEIIEKVSSYFKDRGNTAAVQSGPDSQNNSSWYLNVFVRAAKPFNRETPRRAMQRFLARGLESADGADRIMELLHLTDVHQIMTWLVCELREATLRGVSKM